MQETHSGTATPYNGLCNIAAQTNFNSHLLNCAEPCLNVVFTPIFLQAARDWGDSTF